MKEGWEIKKLGEVCDFQGGSQPPKKDWEQELKDGYVRMLQIRDFTKSRGSIIEYVRKTDKLKYCSSQDILIGRYGASVGKILSGLSGAYNVALIKSIPDENIITKSYIRRYFESAYFQINLQKICHQRAAQAGFSKEDIFNFPIIIPPLSEQQRIVAILDAEFAKIDALKTNAEKSLQAANALFINSIETVFANLEAPLIAVSSVADVASGFAFKSTQFVPKGKYQVVRIGNVKQNSLRLSSSPVFINEIDNKIITKSELKKYDLVVTQTGTKHKMDYGFVAIVDVDNLLLNQRVARIRFKSPRLFAKWFLYYSYTKSYKEQFFAHEGGTVGQGNVSLSAITEMKIPIPDDSRTIKTNIELLDNLDERCKALQENYRKTIALCEDLKQALLRKAFNGEL